MVMALKVSVLCASVTAVAATPRAHVPLTRFDHIGDQRWQAVNDPVMGGVSTGSFSINSGRGVWTGEVKVVPKLRAPGFCSVRTEGTEAFPDLSSTQGLIVQIVRPKSSGLSSLKVGMESSVRASPRQGEFEGTIKLTAAPGQVDTVFVPYSSMTQSWRGQREGGPPSAKQLASIVGLSFIVDGEAGKFDFEIISIAGGPLPSPSPAPSPSPSPSKQMELASFTSGKADGAKWSAVNDPVMGGRSSSSFKVQGDVGVWTGEVRVVPKLHAPGFCRLQGEVAKTDLSSYDGLLFEMSGQGEPTKTLVAVIEARGLLPGRSGQWTANISLTAAGSSFVAFEAFRPFTIRPEPGHAPTKEQLRDIVQVGVLADGTAGEFELSLRSVAAVGRPSPPSPTPATGVDLFRFGKPGVKAWRVTNDPVMGGRSKSTFIVGTDKAGNENVGIFSGDVAIVPALKAPGFCNAFVEIPSADLSEFDAIEITLRSYGPLTAFKSSFAGKGVPKDPTCHHPGCQFEPGSFKAGFNVTRQTASATPQKITIPFDAYTYAWSDFTGGCTDHGAKCCDPTASPNTCPSKTALASITQIGIWGEGTAGDFSLDIFQVRAIKTKAEGH